MLICCFSCICLLHMFSWVQMGANSCSIAYHQIYPATATAAVYATAITATTITTYLDTNPNILWDRCGTQ